MYTYTTASMAKHWTGDQRLPDPDPDFERYIKDRAAYDRLPESIHTILRQYSGDQMLTRLASELSTFPPEQVQQIRRDIMLAFLGVVHDDGGPREDSTP